jgi:hypothetical protein
VNCCTHVDHYCCGLPEASLRTRAHLQSHKAAGPPYPRHGAPRCLWLNQQIQASSSRFGWQRVIEIRAVFRELVLKNTSGSEHSTYHECGHNGSPYRPVLRCMGALVEAAQVIRVYSCL